MNSAIEIVGEQVECNKSENGTNFNGKSARQGIDTSTKGRKLGCIGDE
jgi:hypothetical protein